MSSEEVDELLALSQLADEHMLFETDKFQTQEGEPQLCILVGSVVMLEPRKDRMKHKVVRSEGKQRTRNPSSLSVGKADDPCLQ